MGKLEILLENQSGRIFRYELYSVQFFARPSNTISADHCHYLYPLLVHIFVVATLINGTYFRLYELFHTCSQLTNMMRS